MTDALPLLDLNASLEKQTPFEILEYAIDHFADLAISFSGAEDIVLVHMAKQIDPQIQVFSLDTGRLHPETYQYIEQVRKTYKLNLEILFPEAAQVQALVNKKGLYSFYEDNHQECCGIRKILPLQRKLQTLDAWVTGQRKDQSPGTRANIPVIQDDKHFAGAGRELTKFNPLANWSSRAVWDYIRANRLPYNPLHDRGFISIGCEPCTRAVGPNQHEREGRWWWEESTKKECGLHASNIDK